VRAQGRPKVCTAREKETVLAFARPVMRGESVVVEVYWVYQGRDSQPVGATASLIVIRAGAGEWHVQSMRRTSIS
jgi:hypothetical protein